MHDLEDLVALGFGQLEFADERGHVHAAFKVIHPAAHAETRAAVAVAVGATVHGLGGEGEGCGCSGGEGQGDRSIIFSDVHNFIYEEMRFCRRTRVFVLVVR